MATYNEQLQRIWHAYKKQHGIEPSTLRSAVQWGVTQGMIAIPDADPLGKLVEDMSAALREEYATDSEGRRYRVNHAVRVTKGGVQYTFWAIMKDASRDHMQKAFIQRRGQIVGDCVQLATDVEAYNSMNADKPAIQMVLDFKDDVEERRYWGKKAA